MKLNPGLKGRRVKILGIALVLLGIIAVVGFLTSGKKEGAINKKEQGNIRVLTEADLEREKWRASAEKDIDQLRNSQKELVKEIKSLKDKLSAKEQKEGSLPPLPLPPKNVFPPPPPPPPLPPQTFNGGVTGKTTSGIRVFSPETVSFNSRQPQKEQSNSAKGNWVPSGSFVKGVLLSGLDAPTGVQSKTNPYPVLIRLSEPANLPNLRRLDVKECFATGGGYGDLASERAYIIPFL
jgi:conjugal transfer pilus assembly protein TraB